MSENIKNKRYEIIKPFIKGDKQLKEIQSETGVSYATLKRWVKSYKEAGTKGLKKKQRKDKDQHKSLNQTTVELIQNLYSENPNLKVSKLHEKFSSLLKQSNKEEVSYQTVYRVISNLDTYLQNHAELHIDRARYQNQIFRCDFIEIFNFNANIHFFIYFIYDVASFKMLNYFIYHKEFSLSEHLSFLRDSILKNSKDDSPIYPKEFIIGNIKDLDKVLVASVKNKLNIDVYPSYDSFKEINSLLRFIYEDISKIIDFDSGLSSLDKIEELLNSYINTNCSPIPLEKTLPLNSLLPSKVRRVQSYGIRFNNSTYNFNLSKELVGKKVTIKYNELDYSSIYIYYNDNFIDIAHLK